MEINIKKYLAGAKEADGLAVIIDVFRASNTIIASLAKGAEYIIPINDLDKAYELKKKHPDHLLFGEREGIPPPGFDSDNSPARAMTEDLNHKKIILTTQAGSQGIVNALGAREIVIASFANAKAIINYIKKKNPPIVSLVAMGNKATKPATEDEECAKYIKNRLENKSSNFNDLKTKILNCSGADRLRRLNQKNDLEFATKLDSYNIVPRYDKHNKWITK